MDTDVDHHHNDQHSTTTTTTTTTTTIAGGVDDGVDVDDDAAANVSDDDDDDGDDGDDAVDDSPGAVEEHADQLPATFVHMRECLAQQSRVRDAFLKRLAELWQREHDDAQRQLDAEYTRWLHARRAEQHVAVEKQRLAALLAFTS